MNEKTCLEVLVIKFITLSFSEHSKCNLSLLSLFIPPDSQRCSLLVGISTHCDPHLVGQHIVPLGHARGQLPRTQAIPI